MLPGVVSFLLFFLILHRFLPKESSRVLLPGLRWAHCGWRCSRTIEALRDVVRWHSVGGLGLDLVTSEGFSNRNDSVVPGQVPMLSPHGTIAFLLSAHKNLSR